MDYLIFSFFFVFAIAWILEAPSTILPILYPRLLRSDAVTPSNHRIWHCLYILSAPYVRRHTTYHGVIDRAVLSMGMWAFGQAPSWSRTIQEEEQVLLILGVAVNTHQLFQAGSPQTRRWGSPERLLSDQHTYLTIPRVPWGSRIQFRIPPSVSRN